MIGSPAGEDQLGRVLGEAAERRGDGEHDHAGDEHVSRPEDVAQAS
jgi:hypothetical protein